MLSFASWQPRVDTAPPLVFAMKTDGIKLFKASWPRWRWSGRSMSAERKRIASSRSV